MRFEVIAPPEFLVPHTMNHVETDRTLYYKRISELQRFRGKIYVEDQAIPVSCLMKDGRHNSELDFHSWHLLVYTLDELCGIIRMPVYDIRKNIEELALYNILSRADDILKTSLHYSIQEFVTEACGNYSLISEPGGWAVTRGHRNKLVGIKLAAAAWAILQILGNGVALSSVTVKHNANLLLKRMGGFSRCQHSKSSTFYDDFYKSDLEFVFFYSDVVSKEFCKFVKKVKSELEEARVITSN